MAAYPIRPKAVEHEPTRCFACERGFTKKRHPSKTIIGYGTTDWREAWQCSECAADDGWIRDWGDKPQFIPYPTAIVVEDTVNWRGDYWERSLHPSEARYKKAFGGWVPEGYETDLEELHRTAVTNALEAKFDAS